MDTFAVVSRKGGSGKTTFAVQFAIGLWARGLKVLVADIDPQQSSMEVLKARNGPGPECLASSSAKLFALQTAARRSGIDALIVDTAAGRDGEVAQATTLCDVAVMVVRPTFLDLAAAAYTSRMIRQLGRRGLIVINQATPMRGDVETTPVKRALEAAAILSVQVAPVLIRTRVVYQTALERGRSVEEIDRHSPAAREFSALTDYVRTFAIPTQAANEPHRAVGAA